MTKAKLTHLDKTGAASMVDVGGKAVTERVAVAEGAVTMEPATLDLIVSGNAKKGDVIGAARIAGIMAAKRTHELIPLAHPLALTSVVVDIEPDAKLPGLRVRATAKAVRPDRRRDGGADRGLGRLPHHLRHGQGGRPRHGDRRRPPDREARRQVRHVAGKGRAQVTPLIPVDEAIARIIAGVQPLPVDEVSLADAAWPHTRGASGGAAHPAAVRCLLHGRVRRARRRYRAGAGDAQGRRHVGGGPPLTPASIGGRRGGPHLHRRAGAARRRRRPDPGERRGRQATRSSPVKAGRRRAATSAAPGSISSEGALLLEAGRRLGMREIALAAAMGHATLPVRRRPRVAIIATGDELVPPGTPPSPDQIVCVQLARPRRMRSTPSAARPRDLGIVRDDRGGDRRARSTRRIALPADVLVTIGGASVGDHDLVQEALKERGMALDFWRIAMRPGKPLMFGRIGETRVLGLPGNPVSSLVCAILFLQPLIAALLGQARTDPTEPATLGGDLAANDARQDYIRARLATRRGELPAAMPLPLQDSSMLSVLATADCLHRAPAPCAAPRKPAMPAASSGCPDRWRDLSMSEVLPADLTGAAPGIVWLASYPRSGNTWLRFFLHSLFEIERGTPEAEIRLSENWSALQLGMRRPQLRAVHPERRGARTLCRRQRRASVRAAGHA